MTLRLVVVAVVTFVAIDTAFDGVRILGAAPEPLLAVTAAVGLRVGSRPGALVGFWSGLAVDLLVTTPFGLSAMCFTLAGHGAGLIGERWVRTSWWIAPAAIAAVTAAAGAMFAVTASLLGDTSLLHAQHLAVLVATAVWAVPIGAVVSPAVGWAARGALTGSRGSR